MHWLHSLDQMVYRLGGACFTHTEFARVLHELREDRKHAMSSSFAESFRSQARQDHAVKIISDAQEEHTNILRQKATLFEDRSRHLIAQPALAACRIELFCIEKLLEKTVKFTQRHSPLDFISCQKTENTLALIWKAYIETMTYAALSTDTRSDLLSRGLSADFDFNSVTDRDSFLDRFNSSAYESLLVRDLHTLYNGVLDEVKESTLVLEYEKSLSIGKDDATFLGNTPTGTSTLTRIDQSAG